MRPALLLSFVMLCGQLADAAPKSAKGGANQAKKYLDAAIKLYNAFEFERSLEQLNKARVHAQGADMDVTIGLYEGIVQLELGHDEQAETAFRTALSLEPTASLPTRVSPKVQGVFDRLKSEMTPAVPSPTPGPTVTPKPTDPGPSSAVTPKADPLPPPVEAKQSKGKRPAAWWAPAVAGVLLAGGGTVMLFQAKDRADRLAGRTLAMPELDLATAERFRNEGKVFQTVGFAGIGLGIACVVVSAVLFFLVGS